MNYDYALLDCIGRQYGTSFYLLDSAQFEQNYHQLLAAFQSYYANTQIAYSYKTNYTPKLCKTIDRLGGFAEVVSDMELTLAKRVDVRPERIIFNGPYKNTAAAQALLLEGGCVNADSLPELKSLAAFAARHPEATLHIGIRCNFDIHDGVISRFGIDADSEDFAEALRIVSQTENIVFQELHFHFAVRSLEMWGNRMDGLRRLLERFPCVRPRNIDLGGGLFGKMDETLKAQFDMPIPSYAEYAEVAAKKFADLFCTDDYRPGLLIEPGSALVGDCMKFVAKVTGIKTIRGKAIATVLGSIYNINPTLNKKNPPIQIVRQGSESAHYEDIDFGGYTCIESDYIYRHYSGELAVGDYAVFGNAGSYSIVLKPPFIMPNFAVFEIKNGGAEIEVIKLAEQFDDLFHTFSF